MTRIAYFISPHGYGHAARAAAVMAAILKRQPETHFEILTRVPECFFEASIGAEAFTYHRLLTDIGLVQSSPLHEDLGATVETLNEFLPFAPDTLASLAQQLNTRACQMVLCDIAPLGIAVARQAGLPSVLIENFTWDWIYQGYVASEPRLAQSIEYLQTFSDQADYRIQTRPFCHPRPADLTVNPVSRESRCSPESIRERLNIPQNANMVLITMGGIPEKNYRFLERIQTQDALYCVIPGASDVMEQHGTLVMLPHHSDFYHPDLIHASDWVIGKLGYSTLAETFAAGVPFAYIARPGFRETESLATFADAEMNGFGLTEAELQSGDWLEDWAERWAAVPRQERSTLNGAGQIADFVLQRL